VARYFFFPEIRKILFVENLFVEKRRERLHIGECRGTWKPVIPWVRVGSGFYSLFALPDGGDAFQMQTGIS
jgi:hypothetical protein